MTIGWKILIPISIANLFVGRIGGCIGETCALALLVGGAYAALFAFQSIVFYFVYAELRAVADWS